MRPFGVCLLPSVSRGLEGAKAYFIGIIQWQT